VDIHPPHLPIHTWKDFLLHLLTITIGLFIALTLEAAVESTHHRHLVRDAHENLRREVESNQKVYAKNVRELRLNRNQLARDIDQLRELRNGKKLENPNLSWTWNWDSYGDAAWKTARESGAVASQFHIPEAIEPYSSELVGARRRIVLGKKSGLDSIDLKAKELGLTIASDDRGAILAAVKKRAIAKRGLLTDDEFSILVSELAHSIK